MLAANNQPPALAVRTNSSRISRPELVVRFEQAQIAARPTAYSQQGILLQGEGKPDQLPGYAQGLWQVQDEAAQLVVEFADFPEGAKTLDACAAPGGKACHLAERSLVVATDNRKIKLLKLEAEAKRLGVLERIETQVHDATSPFPEAWGPFAGVLVDEPCSGLGTLRSLQEVPIRIYGKSLLLLA